jgi:hypothetical protein
MAVTIDGNTKEIRYEVKTKTPNYAEIVLLDNSDNQVSGQIDVNVQGYGKVRGSSL